MTHAVKLSDEEKRTWFNYRIAEHLKVTSIQSRDELIHLVHFLRKTFKTLFGRDVPGSFVRQVLKEHGVDRPYSEKVQLKRSWMFTQLDENQALRESKLQMKKLMNHYWKEKMLGILFDELWSEYFARDTHPKPVRNVDIYGSAPLFE